MSQRPWNYIQYSLYKLLLNGFKESSTNYSLYKCLPVLSVCLYGKFNAWTLCLQSVNFKALNIRFRYLLVAYIQLSHIDNEKNVFIQSKIRIIFTVNNFKVYSDKKWYDLIRYLCLLHFNIKICLLLISLQFLFGSKFGLPNSPFTANIQTTILDSPWNPGHFKY